MRITAAEPGKVNFELPIEKQHTNRLGILHGATLATMVDTSGSLAVASRGLYATGVSTDLSVTYLNAGGKIGDLVKGEVICDKCRMTISLFVPTASIDSTCNSWKDPCIHVGQVHEQKQRDRCSWKSHEIRRPRLEGREEHHQRIETDGQRISSR